MINNNIESKGIRNIKITWFISLLMIILGFILVFTIKDKREPITGQEFVSYVTNQSMKYDDLSGYYDEYNSKVLFYSADGESASKLNSYKLGFVVFEDVEMDEVEQQLKEILKESSYDYKIARVENTILYAACSDECGDDVSMHFQNLKYNKENPGGLFIGLGFALIAMLYLLGMWRLYEKAGKKGYAMFIPLYGNYQEADIAFNKGWLFILIFIPIVNYFYELVLYYNIAKKFNKSKEFCIGNAIIPLVFVPIIGFDESIYQKQ